MKDGPRRWRRAGAVLAAAWLLAALLPQASGQPEYSLYYHFEIPLTVLGLTVTDDGTKRTYKGTLLGTLGGIPVTDSRYTYANGATAQAGGGTFSMTTRAGSVRDGQVLMTSDGTQTTLLFLGTYLGTDLSFSIVGTGDQIGGSGVTADGLAETTFRSHEHYIAAVQEATTAFPQAMRTQIIAQASQNPRLVREYQQRSTPR
ncbi:MAG TPA: hypothetical protein VEW91_09025 [bacterium]|nr:hypothetical protein [bacterium]